MTQRRPPLLGATGVDFGAKPAISFALPARALTRRLLDEPDPTGACCIEGVCSILTAAACLAASGTYQGDGTTCDPNPCGCPDAPTTMRVEISYASSSCVAAGECGLNFSVSADIDETYPVVLSEECVFNFDYDTPLIIDCSACDSFDDEANFEYSGTLSYDPDSLEWRLELDMGPNDGIGLCGAHTSFCGEFVDSIYMGASPIGVHHFSDSKYDITITFS